MTYTSWYRQKLPAALAPLLLASTLLGSVVTGTAPAAAAPVDLDDDGAWSPLADWPMVAIHAAVDKNGNVVTYGTNGDGRQTGQFIYDIWTPGPSAAGGHDTLTNTTQTDLFCSLQLNSADTGEMILFGGDNWTGAGTTNTGNPDINVLDVDSRQLTTIPGMNRARWYATGTTLPDGTIFVQGGTSGEDHPEHWSPTAGSNLLPLDTSGLSWYYPRNFVAPDGRLFGIDTNGWMYYVSADLAQLDIVGRLGPAHRGIGATAVMFQPGKILHFGGPTNTSSIIDITGGAPVVTASGALSTNREWVNGVLLPDGRVLAVGGANQGASWNDGSVASYGVAYTAEVWDPRTGVWTQQAAGAVPRLYHSTALLLPDGRVLSAGGGSPGPVTNTNAELFSPDYLRTAAGTPAPRPTITGISADELTPGQSFNLSVGNGADIERVTLVKTGSATHAFNMDQRFVELGFATNGNTVTAALPASSAVLTPGYYMLSVLDENDIPSTSQIVEIAAPSPDTAVSAIDGQVIRMYRAYFQRNPDASGYQYWRQQRFNGIGLDVISDVFAGSPEFIGRYGNLSNTQFVDRLYQNVLGRTPDAGGRAYWINQLTGGVTRGQVMVAFSESPEFVAFTGTPGPNGPAPTPLAPPSQLSPAQYVPEVYRLYLGYFGRTPDDAGLDYWTNVRADGYSLITVSDQFALSAEFQARYGAASDAGFVDLIYANVLQRVPDPSGRAYWIQQLAQGVTRGELMIGFTESPEFQNGRGKL